MYGCQQDGIRSLLERLGQFIYEHVAGQSLWYFFNTATGEIGRNFFFNFLGIYHFRFMKYTLIHWKVDLCINNVKRN